MERCACMRHRGVIDHPSLWREFWLLSLNVFCSVSATDSSDALTTCTCTAKMVTCTSASSYHNALGSSRHFRCVPACLPWGGPWLATVHFKIPVSLGSARSACMPVV
jgi:hypothetical protein